MKTLFHQILVVGFLFSFSSVLAQNSAYTLLSSKEISQTTVRLQIKTFCGDKNQVDYEAACAAVKSVIFYGIPNTRHKAPLLKDGETTSYQQHTEYFDNLFYTRIMDFVPRLVMLSKFKKADKDKSTLYEIDVDVILLRKDLEKNNVKRSMGI